MASGNAGLASTRCCDPGFNVVLGRISTHCAPSPLSLGSPLTEPLPNYNVSAIGFYGSMAAGKIRIDTLQVSGTPASFPATPPSVSQPVVGPLNRLDNTAWTGTPVTFSATASGTPPLSYQWRKDGINIAATTNVWTLASPAVSDSGNYDLVVSNGGGSVTSAVVALTVSPAKLFINQHFNQSTNDPGVIGQTPGWHVLALNLTNATVTDYTFAPNPPLSLNFPNLSRGPVSTRTTPSTPTCTAILDPAPAIK